MKKTWISIFEMTTLLALLFAPLSLLFVDNNLLFPYITSKNFMWRLAIDIALVSWASLALLDMRYRINIKNPLLITFSVFMFVMLLANTLGIDPYRSFWSNAERMDGYVGLLHMFGFFIAFVGFAQAQVKESVSYNWFWFVMFVLTIGSTYTSTIGRTMVTEPGGSSIGWFMLTLITIGLGSVGAWFKPTFTKSFFHGLLALGIVFGVMAMLQSKARADAILGNPIYLASYSSFALFVSGYYLIMKEKLFGLSFLREGVYGSLIVFFLWVIFETSTRGAVLGLVFGGFVTAVALVITAREKDEQVWRYLGAALCAVVLMSIGGFFALKSTISQGDQFADGSLIKRAAGFSLTDKTTKHRLANWEQAIDGFKERPVLGWGQENYIHVFSKYYQADKLHDGEQWFDRTHNMFLDWLVFGGIAGLGAFLALLGTCLWMIWKRTAGRLSNLERSVLTGIIVAYMAQNFVAFDALATGMWITAVMALLALCYVSPKKESSKPIQVQDEVAVLSIVALWICTLLWIIYSFVLPRSAVYNFMGLLQGVPTGQTIDQAMQVRLPKVEKALNAETLFTLEFTEQLLSRRNLYLRKEVSEGTQVAYLGVVTTKAQEQIDAHPHLTRLQLFYGNFLEQSNAPDRAKPFLEQALAGSPEKIQIMWALGQNSLRLNDAPGALEYFKRAAEIAPSSQRAQQVYEQITAQFEEK